MVAGMYHVRLYLIRHAQSEINAVGTVICGQSISCTLSPLGCKQATLLGERWKYQNMKFDYMLCSTAVRTNQTAEIALNALNMDVSKLIVSSELLEQSQGDWEGMSYTSVFTPETLQQLDDLHFEFCPPNGESKRTVQKHAIAFLEPMLDQAKQQSIEENRPVSVVVFTHANFIQCVLQYYLQSNPKYAWLIRQHNTAINEIVFNQHGTSIIKINDDSHLTFSIPEISKESSN